jgi:hypothetical protein
MTHRTLTYQIYVTPILATATKDIPPGQSRSNLEPHIGHPDLRPAGRRPGRSAAGRPTEPSCSPPSEIHASLV